MSRFLSKDSEVPLRHQHSQEFSAQLQSFEAFRQLEAEAVPAVFCSCFNQQWHNFPQNPRPHSDNIIVLS